MTPSQDSAEAATSTLVAAAETMSRSSSGVSVEDGFVDLGASRRKPEVVATEPEAQDPVVEPTSTVVPSIPHHARFGAFVQKHEIPRKILHVSWGFATLWLYTLGVSIQQVTPVLATLLFIIGSTDLIRHRWPEFNDFYVGTLGFLMRDKEVSGYNGVIWYLLGLVIVFSIFPKDISLLSLLLLSWSDTAASTFGRAYGHLTPSIGRKSLAGSLAAAVLASFSAWLVYFVVLPGYPQVNLPGDIMWHEQTSLFPAWVLIAFAGLVGAVSEALEVVDDNLSIPVLSACFMWTYVKLTTSGAYDAEVFA